MKKILVQVLLGCSLLVSVRAQTLTEASAESVGMSTERLKRIDAVVQDYVQQGRVPGAVVLVARNGKVVYHKGLGYDDLSTKTPLNKDAIMRIASQTKAITSLAVMMLFEEGKFLLDDPISKYIPAFKNPKVIDKFNEQDTTFTTVPAKQEVTIRQLLTHTSGISYPAIGGKQATMLYAKYKIPSGIGTPNATLSDAINALAVLPLVHQPGERFTYGLNVDVLGYLVEILSGTTLDAFVRERICAPLGMDDTFFYLPESKHSRLALLYTEDANKKTELTNPAKHGTDPNFPKLKGKFYSGGAGLSSTALDYAAFLQLFLNGGEYKGKRLLSPLTVKLMTTNQIGNLSLGTKKFGLGFSIATAGEEARTMVSEGSFDWGGIFGTTYWADPKEGIVALIMTQKYPNTGNDLADKFRTLVYQSVIKSNR
jgi:CubicO group peptidase (beta-lactamase class C family)